MSALLLLIGGGSAPPPTQHDLQLAELADRYCIEPDGDHRLTWHRAEQDGFAWITPDDAPNLRLPSALGTNLRGLKKTVDGVEIQVLTSAFSWIAPDDGQSFFRQCWVSASVSDVNSVRRDVRAILGVHDFKSLEVVIFAWIPTADGGRTSVSRRDYRRRHLTLAREQGMRQVLVRQYENGVFVSYTSPRDEATYRDFDWAGPEPVAAPE